MRDIILKHLTSLEKGRKIMTSSEVVHTQGLCQIIHRHFIYKIKEIKNNEVKPLPKPILFIFKEHNSYERKEKFFYKFKSSLYLVNNHKLYLVEFLHSLRINLFLEPYSLR
ncbi:MAG: hypothetical protein N2Z79_02985 [Candidatus Omnitrophica bacterium]|nr:hypothetical protein [Candidatus Omnitrophota bacterium]